MPRGSVSMSVSASENVRKSVKGTGRDAIVPTVAAVVAATIIRTTRIGRAVGRGGPPLVAPTLKSKVTLGTEVVAESVADRAAEITEIGETSRYTNVLVPTLSDILSKGWTRCTGRYGIEERK